MAYPFLALILVLTSMPLFIKAAKRFNLYDEPDDERKTHTGRIPYTGGFSIVIAFAISVFIMWNLEGWSVLAQPRSDYMTMFMYILEASIIIFLLGIFDDFKDLTFTKKFLFQFFAATFLILGATKANLFPKVFNTTESGVLINSFGTMITLLWIVGTTNAINMIDGMDGLAGGTSLISSIAMGILALAWGNTFLGLILFILAGALLGFLFYNRAPARVFMGDTGSMFLGFILAVSGWILVDSTPSRLTAITVPILLLGLPISDTLLAFFRRLVKKKNPFSADTFHIHHMLKLRFKLSTKKTVLILYGVSSLYCIVGVTVAFVPDSIGWILIGCLVGAKFYFLHILGYTRLLLSEPAEPDQFPDFIVKTNGISYRSNGNGVHHHQPKSSQAES